MPKLNRRLFLQIASAAGLAPALPALPASGAVATRGMSSAQMLWVSMYKRAETASDLGGLARSMGISREAAKGVYTRLIQTQALAAHSVGSVSRATQPAATPTKAAVVKTTTPAKPVTSKLDIRRIVSDHMEEGDEPASDTVPDEEPFKDLD